LFVDTLTSMWEDTAGSKVEEISFTSLKNFLTQILQQSLASVALQKVSRGKSLLNTHVDNLQYWHFGQCSTKCMSVADTLTVHSCYSCKIFTSLAAAVVAAVFVTVHAAAAICVFGTILGVVTAACYPNSLSKHSWQ